MSPFGKSLDAALRTGAAGVQAVSRDHRRFRAARREWYSRVWEAAAAEIGATATRRGESLLEIRRDGAATWVDESATDLDGPATRRAVDDDELVAELLSLRGLPTPARHAFTAANPRGARAFLGEHERCVVKPRRRASGGRGVTMNVTSSRGLGRAIARAASGGNDLVVQEQVDGVVLRVLVLDGRILDAVWRRPPGIVGDGEHAIHQLIEIENDLRRQELLARCQSILTVDRDLLGTLRRAGLDMGEVLAEGQRIDLKTVVHQNTLAETADVTRGLDMATGEIAVAAAQAVGVRLAGVGLILAGPDAPPDSRRCVVLGVDAKPGLFPHHQPEGNRVVVPILEECLTTRFEVDVPGRGDVL